MLYLEIVATLENADIENAAHEADIIISAVCGKQRLLLGDISGEEAEKIRGFAAKRAAREPLQYILGEWQFLGVNLKIGEGVLIPRPETEEVCLAAAKLLEGKQNPTALDLCSGSGAIALALQSLVPMANVTALEIDDKAFEYLTANISKNDMPTKAIKADVFEYYKQLEDESIDLIVSNPPYVTSEEYEKLEPEVLAEPARALLAADEGLEFYIAIARDYAPKLAKGGWLVFEIGYTQGAAVAGILQQNGYENVEIRKDMAGCDRVLLASVIQCSQT